MLTGYTTTSPSDVNIQVAAITSVDAPGMRAVAQTRQGTDITIDLRYYVGATHVIPAVGEQWFVSWHRGIWRLADRIPYQNSGYATSPTQGQTQIGSSGPTEVGGSVVNIRAEMTLQDARYRDTGSRLERQNTDGTWSVVGPTEGGITSMAITEASVLGRLLLTAPDVATVLSILGLAVAGAGLDGGTSDSANVDPIVSGGSVSGPGVGADLDGGTPESSGDITVTGGTP